MLKVSSSLWFEKDVQQAVEFYVATIPSSSMGRTTILPAETPSGPPGSVKIIDFKLGDQQFTAMEAGPLDAFNHAFSISVQCETQEEIDRIWNAFLTNGGVEEHFLGELRGLAQNSLDHIRRGVRKTRKIVIALQTQHIVQHEERVVHRGLVDWHRSNSSNSATGSLRP